MVIDWETCLPTATDPKLIDGVTPKWRPQFLGGLLWLAGRVRRASETAQPEMIMFQDQKTGEEAVRPALHQFPAGSSRACTPKSGSTQTRGETRE